MRRFLVLVLIPLLLLASSSALVFGATDFGGGDVAAEVTGGLLGGDDADAVEAEADARSEPTDSESESESDSTGEPTASSNDVTVSTGSLDHHPAFSPVDGATVSPGQAVPVLVSVDVESESFLSGEAVEEPTLEVTVEGAEMTDAVAGDFDDATHDDEEATLTAVEFESETRQTGVAVIDVPDAASEDDVIELEATANGANADPQSVEVDYAVEESDTGDALAEGAAARAELFGSYAHGYDVIFDHDPWDESVEDAMREAFTTVIVEETKGAIVDQLPGSEFATISGRASDLAHGEYMGSSVGQVMEINHRLTNDLLERMDTNTEVVEEYGDSRELLDELEAAAKDEAAAWESGDREAAADAIEEQRQLLGYQYDSIAGMDQLDDEIRSQQPFADGDADEYFDSLADFGLEEALDAEEREQLTRDPDPTVDTDRDASELATALEELPEGENETVAFEVENPSSAGPTDDDAFLTLSHDESLEVVEVDADDGDSLEVNEYGPGDDVANASGDAIEAEHPVIDVASRYAPGESETISVTFERVEETDEEAWFSYRAAFHPLVAPEDLDDEAAQAIYERYPAEGPTDQQEFPAVNVSEGDAPAPPTPGIDVDEETPTVADEVTFDASESAAEAGVESYEWELHAPDGSTTNEQGETATKAFDEPGEATATLTVTDETGIAVSTETSIVVEADAPDDPVRAEFAVDRSYPEAGDEVTVEATRDADAYEWEFERADGSTESETGETISIEFAESGAFEVSLTAERGGETDETTRTLRVAEREERVAEPEVVVDLPETVDEGETVEIDASESYHPHPEEEISDVALVVDGATEEVNSEGVFSHTFDTPGEVPLEVAVLGTNDRESAVERTVIVGEEDELPEADFDYEPSDPVVDEAVTFDAGDSTAPDGEIESYEWQVAGEGVVSSGETTSIKFPTSGERSVELTVTDDEDRTASTSERVTVEERPAPEAKLEANATEVRTGETVELDASGSTAYDGVESYEWYVDGAPGGHPDATGETLTHAFDESGERTVTLVVEDDAGETDAAEVTIDVEAVLVVGPDAEYESLEAADDDAEPGYAIEVRSGEYEGTQRIDTENLDVYGVDTGDGLPVFLDDDWVSVRFEAPDIRISNLTGGSYEFTDRNATIEHVWNTTVDAGENATVRHSTFGDGETLTIGSGTTVEDNEFPGGRISVQGMENQVVTDNQMTDGTVDPSFGGGGVTMEDNEFVDSEVTVGAGSPDAERAEAANNHFVGDGTLEAGDRADLRDNVLEDGARIELGGHNATVERNEVTNASLSGISTLWSDDVRDASIVGNTVTGDEDGISLREIDGNVTIADNEVTITSNNVGIRLSDGNESEIRENEVDGGSISANGIDNVVLDNELDDGNVNLGGTDSIAESNEITGDGDGYGISVGGHDNVVRDNRIETVDTGIDASDRGDPDAVTENLIVDNDVDADRYGVRVGGDGNAVRENAITTDRIGASISIERPNATVEANHVYESAEGISLDTGIDGWDEGPTIRDNRIETVDRNGLYVQDADGTTVVDNEFVDGDSQAVQVKDSSDVELRSNDFVENNQDVRFEGDATGAVIEDNAFARTDGVMLIVEADGTVVEGNEFDGTLTQRGIDVGDVADVEILDNALHTTSVGLSLDGTDDGVVSGNEIRGADVGVSVDDGVEATIANNLFANERNVWGVDSTDVEWNEDERDGPNVVGGDRIGGNAWGDPDGTGFSDEAEPDQDGFAEEPYVVDEDVDAVDERPLACDDDCAAEERPEFEIVDRSISLADDLEADLEGEPGATVEAIVTTRTGHEFLAEKRVELNDEGDGVVGFDAAELGTGNHDLRVRYDGGVAYESTDHPVTVFEEDVDAEFDADPEIADPGEPVAFDAGETFAIEDVDRYEWDFDDGSETESEEPTVDHAFEEPGTYEVALTVVDVDGNADETIETVGVVEGETAELSGSIETPDGDPVTDGEVVALEEDRSAPVDDGTYAVDVPHYDEVTIAYRSDVGDADDAPDPANLVDVQTLERVETDHDAPDRNLTVPTGHPVEIDVVDEDDEPIESATVEFVHHDDEGDESASLELETEVDGTLDTFEDRDGLRLNGTVTMTVTAPGEEYVEDHEEVLDVDEAIERTVVFEPTETAEVTIEPDRDRVAPGETVTADVEVDSEADVMEAATNFAVDPNVLRPTDVEAGEFLSRDGAATFHEAKDVDEANGFVVYAESRSSDGIDGSGTLATIEYEAQAVEGAETTEIDDHVSFTDENREEIPVEVETSEIEVDGDTDHGAKFEVTVDQVDEPVTAGDELVVNATVENVGDEADEQPVELRDEDDEVLDSEPIELEPDDSAEAGLVWVTDEDDAGEHELTVASQNESDEITVTVEKPPEPPQFAVAIDDEETDDVVGQGETLSVAATVENVGDDAGAQSIDLDVGDETAVQTVDEVELDGGEDDVVAFEYDVPADADTGETELAVRSDDDQAETTVEIGSTANLTPPTVDAPAVVAGDELAVDVAVENVGDGAAERNLTAEVGDERLNTSLDLEPGETATETVTYGTTDEDVPGVVITATIDDESTTDTARVRSPDPATLAVSAIDTPAEAAPGEEIAVEATIENVGDLDGESEQVALRADGDVVATEQVDLSAGEAVDVSLQHEFSTEPRAGVHDVPLAVETEDEGTTESVAVDYGGIDSGVDAADPDDRIAVADGTYDGGLTVDTRNVTIAPVGPDADPRIDATDDGVGATIEAENVTLSGVAIEGGGDDTGVVAAADGTWLEGATFADLETGVELRESDEHVVAHNTFDATVATGIELVDAGDSRIERNEIGSEREASVDAAGDAAPADGVVVGPGTDSPTIDENDVDVAGDAIVVDADADGPGVATANNLVGDNLSVANHLNPTTFEGEGNYHGDLEERSLEDRTLGRVDDEPIGEPYEGAEYAVTIEDAPDAVTAGESATVEATIENLGDYEGLQDVTLSVDGMGVDAVADARIPAGEVYPVTFEFEPGADDVAETAEMTASSEDDSDQTNLEIRTAPDVSIDSLDVPPELTAGEGVSVTATLENDGGEGFHDVELRLGQALDDPDYFEVLATEAVDLDAGGETAVEVDGTVPEDADDGAVLLGVAVADGLAEATTALSATDETPTDDGGGPGVPPAPPEEPAESPQFDLGPIDAPDTVSGGDQVPVEISVTNVGDGDGSVDLTVLLDGEVVTTEPVDVAAGDETAVETTVSAPPAAGTVDLVVQAPDDEAAATLAVDDESGDETVEPSDDADDESIPGFGVGAAVAALSLLAALAGLDATRRRARD